MAAAAHLIALGMNPAMNTNIRAWFKQFNFLPPIPLSAGQIDTVTTSVFDLALGYDWPSRFPDRVLRSALWQRWAGREDALRSDADLRAALAAEMAGDAGVTDRVEAGQGVGLLTESRSAAEVIEELCRGADALLRSWAPTDAR